jgi:menaquinone-dependent protoporphyrinogen oxidase
MNVLVAAASKHGSTQEIAEAIGRTLADAGVTVDVQPVGQVKAVDAYDAVVLGSAVYIGTWTREAKAFVRAHGDSLARRPVWIFSSGPVGTPPKPDAHAAVKVDEIVEAVHPRGHELFAGKIDHRKLGIAERAVTRAVHATEGDFRDWPRIEAWARSIAQALTRTPAS